MSESSPCILVARPDVLEELHAGCMLPERFLHLCDTRLEDTATEAFLQTLRTSGVVAVPASVLTDTGDTEPLSPEARRDYLSNLEQRLRRTNTVYLHVVRKDDPPDWADHAVDLLKRISGEGPGGRAAGTFFLVVVMLCPLDDERHKQLSKFDALLMHKRYLMTEELQECEERLVQAEWVWPASVARLLMWLRTHDHRQEQCGGWYAWQTVDVGPRPSDEQVEALRMAWTRSVLLPKPIAGQQIEHPALTAPTRPERLESDPEVEETVTRTDVPLDHESMALHQGLRGLRMTAGDADDPSSDAGGRPPTAFSGWSVVSERYGDLVARARRRLVASDSARSSPDLADFRTYVRQLHAFAGNVLAIPESPPPESTPQSVAHAAKPDQQRRQLTRLADIRVQRRVDAQNVLLAAQERDLADLRFMPLARRLNWGLVALACTLATWLALSRFLIESWIDTNPLLVHGCIVGGATLGYLGGAIIPWFAERTCMDRANALLDGNLRARREERIADIESIRTSIIAPADAIRRERLRHIAWEQVCTHCLRLRHIIESVVSAARLPSLAAMESLEARVPDEFRNLWKEDTAEYREGTFWAQSSGTVEDELSIVRKLSAALPRRVQASTERSKAGELATKVPEQQGAGNYPFANSTPQQPDLDTIAQMATKWTAIAAQFDPDSHAHLPSGSLRASLSQCATQLRSLALEHLTHELIQRIEKQDGKAIKDSLPKRETLMKPNFLSCRIAGLESISDSGHLFIRKALPDTIENPLKKLLGSDVGGHVQTSNWVASLALYFREVPIEIQPAGNSPAAHAPYEIRLQKDPGSHGKDRAS